MFLKIKHKQKHMLYSSCLRLDVKSGLLGALKYRVTNTFRISAVKQSDHIKFWLKQTLT